MIGDRLRLTAWLLARALTLGLLALGMLACLCAAAPAQEPAKPPAPGGRIIDRAPFDRITLDAANMNKVLTVRPLKLADRRVPEPPQRRGKLPPVYLFDDPQEYEILWKDVDEVKLYEELVLEEANALVAAGKFDEAYDYFVFMLDRYPDTPGLKESQQAYLYGSAGAAFRQQKYDEALAICEELLAQNPSYRAAGNAPALMQVLGGIADKLIARYVDADDYAPARILLKRLVSRYRADSEPFAVKWRDTLTGLATKYRDEAREHLAAQRYVEAYDACAAMNRIWPDVEGGAELVVEMARQYPLFIVGVDRPAEQFDSGSLVNPAARRAGRLVERKLFEFLGPGPEGGRYVCPLGSVDPSVDGLELVFDLNAGTRATSYDLARLLVGWTKPGAAGFQPAWARAVDSIAVAGPGQLTARLKSPQVLPAALLQHPYDANPQIGQPGVAGTGPFIVYSRDGGTTRYTRNERGGAPRTGPAEVMERMFDDPERALAALQRGEIDILAHVFPGDVPALAADSNLAVAQYAVPTTHLVVFREKHPYLANRTFRRALNYGLNREAILRQGLLEGNDYSGFGVISGPFPAPFSGGDSPAYGYDQQIEPRPYDPRLGLTLRIVGQNEVKGAHDKLEKPVPPLRPIVLGHPADETARIACRAIAAQWKLIGVETALVEFAPGAFEDVSGNCDAIYLEAALWEPTVDAARLLGPEGLAPTSNGFIQLTLRQIEQATNWQQVRQRFRQLHRQLHEDVTVLPLFQTQDHYAYRKSLGGLSEPRVTLYENVEQWQVAPRLARTGP